MSAASKKNAISVAAFSALSDPCTELASMDSAKSLRIVAQRRMRLSKEQAEGFYDVHRARPFFDSLVTFMTSGPVVVQVLEGENAIVRNREIMGATNPEEAAERTIRKDFALNIEQNTVHGSDSPETAAREIAFFFSETELVNPS